MLRTVDGKIIAKGWMLEHLNRDKSGISGNLDKLSPDAACGIFEDKKVLDEIDGYWSSWWPGETEGNWRDAFTRLAFALDDPELIDETKAYVDSILSYQEDDGYIGIFKKEKRFSADARSGELWTQSRIMTCLLSYYENTREYRIIEALERLTDLIIRQYGPLAGGRSLYEIPDEDGSKTHSLMVIEPILAVYDIVQKPEYLSFCEFLYEDYSQHAINAKFPCYDISWIKVLDPHVPFVGHGPHTCEQLRIPLLLYIRTGNKKYYNVYLSAFEKLKKYLSLSGSCKSDEMIGVNQGQMLKGVNGTFNLGDCYPIPEIGYEYCSTTELMFTFTAALRSTTDMGYADYEEWMIMNAAMAARRQDGKAILYLSADNLYEATKVVGDRWNYSPTHIDAAVCCAPNSCKIMPYHLQNMWLEDDEGLYAVFYGPSTLRAKVDGKAVVIEQNTVYPFENKVEFLIRAVEPITKKLFFRIPNWCEAVKVTQNDRPMEVQIIESGFGRSVCLENCMDKEVRITLEFVCEPRILEAVDGTKAISYGPLLYSKDIRGEAENYFKYEVESFYDTNYRPAEGENWDYRMLVDKKEPQKYIKVIDNNCNGFEWENPPTTIEALMLNRRAEPQWIRLVPIGSTILRRTTFNAIDKKGRC